MPIYNTQNFLAECICSVINQSLYDIEIILVNDGSIDSSEAICQMFVNQDSRVKYFYQTNKGVSVARNYGLSMASGDYVYFIDSDDTIDSEFLSLAYNNAINNNSDIVILGEYFKDRMPNPAALPPWAMLIKKSFLNKYSQIRFPENIQPCEDGLFSHQLLALDPNISLESNCKYFYRQHENNNHLIINNNSDIIINQIPQWFQILINFYNEYNLWNQKAEHLLAFVEHEPFELRFCKMPLNYIQKEHLYTIIKNFYFENLAMFIKPYMINKRSKLFTYFINSKSLNDFNYKKNRLFLSVKIRLWGVNLIPFKKLRKNLRQKIVQKNNVLLNNANS